MVRGEWRANSVYSTHDIFPVDQEQSLSFCATDGLSIATTVQYCLRRRTQSRLLNLRQGDQNAGGDRAADCCHDQRCFRVCYRTAKLYARLDSPSRRVVTFFVSVASSSNAK